jgi:hypothetical protein
MRDTKNCLNDGGKIALNQINVMDSVNIRKSNCSYERRGLKISYNQENAEGILFNCLYTTCISCWYPSRPARPFGWATHLAIYQVSKRPGRERTGKADSNHVAVSQHSACVHGGNFTHSEQIDYKLLILGNKCGSGTPHRGHSVPLFLTAVGAMLTLLRMPCNRSRRCRRSRGPLRAALC